MNFLYLLLSVCGKHNASRIYSGAVGVRGNSNFENHHGDAVDPKSAYEW